MARPGTDSSRVFGCPVCGFRVNRTDGSCPRCSTPIGGSAELECPFCGGLVDPRSRTCPHCHVDYADFKAKAKARAADSNIDGILNEIIELESYQMRQTDTRFACPNCSWLLNGTEDKCPKCGNSLSGEYALQCPICGAPAAADSISCPECGSKFAGEERATTAPPMRREAAPEAPVITVPIVKIVSKPASPAPEPPTNEEPIAPERELEPTEASPEAPEPDGLAELEKLKESMSHKKATTPGKKKTRKLKARPKGGKS